MKSLTKKATLIPILALLISAYVFASASLINISKHPELSAIEKTIGLTSYDVALLAQFNFEEEEYINDIPYSIIREDALLYDFDFEDEEYINDIPESIIQGTL